ncbi:hypothetical protein KXW17_008446, partial [Aspergillus fumigatus]
GIQTHDLLACVAALEEDPMDATKQAVQVIWDIIEQVALVWSEKGQTLYWPLLAYMDEVVIQKYVQPWQQILAFIACSPDPDPQGSQGSQAVDPGAWAMTAIEKRYYSYEYESALVCAMAVLGQGEAGWRDPESYPLILSCVIKVARFMVVQKALWMDPNLW